MYMLCFFSLKNVTSKDLVSTSGESKYMFIGLYKN